jgi:hypothetical protein
MVVPPGRRYAWSAPEEWLAGPERPRGFLGVVDLHLIPDEMERMMASSYHGGWIRQGDSYPDHQLRLWQRGRAHWGGVGPHGRIEVEGNVDVPPGDLLH